MPSFARHPHSIVSFYRQAIREAPTRKRVRSLALMMVDEIENCHVEFDRLGYLPPVCRHPSDIMSFSLGRPVEVFSAEPSTDPA